MVDSKENDNFDLQVKGLTINDLDFVWELGFNKSQFET